MFREILIIGFKDLLLNSANLSKIIVGDKLQNRFRHTTHIIVLPETFNKLSLKRRYHSPVAAAKNLYQRMISGCLQKL